MVMKIENDDYCAYRNAISMWGCTKIQLKAVEELNELSIELVRSLNGTGDYHKIIEEITDVMIMCEQIFVIFDDGTFRKEWDKKMQRFKNMLDKNKTEEMERCPAPQSTSP